MRPGVSIAFVALALVGCGGGTEQSGQTTSTASLAAPVGEEPTVEQLSLDWVRVGSKLLVRFSRDGTFAMDYENGDLDRPSAAQGTYELDGSMVTFENEGPGFCPAGGTWAWDVRVVDGEDLRVEWVDGGCAIETGTLWRLTPRLVQPDDD